MPSALRRLLRLLASLSSLPVGAWHIVQLRRCGTRHHALCAKQCVESLGLPAPVAGGSPLRRLSPGVFEIERRWFAPFPQVAQPGLTVVHLLATGEHLHSPLPGLEKQCLLQPSLAAYRHLVVDIPADPSAFASPSSYAAQQWRCLRPVLEETPGHVLLVGLGVGALAAIDMAPRIAVLEARRVGVLALSPPVAFAGPGSSALRHVRALGPLVARFVRAERGMPALLLRAHDWALRRAAATAASHLLTDHNVDSRPYLRWAAWDITQRRSAASLQRLCLELSLLDRLRSGDFEAHHARAAATLGGHPSVLSAMMWGTGDRWLSVDDALARSQAACRIEDSPAERVRFGLLPGFGHLIGRDSVGDYGELALRFVEACERVGAQVRPTRESHIRMKGPGHPAPLPVRRSTRRS